MARITRMDAEGCEPHGWADRMNRIDRVRAGLARDGRGASVFRTDSDSERRFSPSANYILHALIESRIGGASSATVALKLAKMAHSSATVALKNRAPLPPLLLRGEGLERTPARG